MSPVSKVRKRSRPTESQPDKSPAAREAARRRYRRKLIIIRAGVVLMIAGVLLAAEHAAAHLGAFGGEPSNVVDLTAGWPLAAVIFLVGVVMAGQRRY